MRQTIHKYSIDLHWSQTVSMPCGARILTAQFQGDQLCLWALVDQDEKMMLRKILIFGTGHKINVPIGTTNEGVDEPVYSYVSTVQKDGHVWHIFADLY